MIEGGQYRRLFRPQSDTHTKGLFYFAMTSIDHSVLKPGRGIDLVKDLHSLAPVSHASVIFEATPEALRLIVGAPGISLNRDEKRGQGLHITTMIHLSSGKKKRVGFPCEIIKTIPNYPLANGTTTPALVLSYTLKVEDVNVRSAFRLSPTPTHEVLGKLIIAGHEFFSGNQFRICDISTTGLGLIIPRLVHKAKNPLTALETRRIARFGIVMKKNHPQNKPQIDTLDTVISIVRINQRFNEASIFIGCRFKKIDRKGEEMLGHFIHEAQLHEIRSITHM